MADRNNHTAPSPRDGSEKDRQQSPVPIVYATAAPTHDGAEVKKILILVVDDVPKNNPQEIQYLENKGYNVITTTSTSSAMTLFHNGIQPDVIISDMGRREGDFYEYNPTAGLLLITKIRESGRITPIIIFTTAENVDTYRQETLRLGGNDIVYQSRDLYDAVERALPMALAHVEEWVYWNVIRHKSHREQQMTFKGISVHSKYYTHDNSMKQTCLPLCMFEHSRVYIIKIALLFYSAHVALLLRKCS